jgi:hypothetical protein
MAKFLRKPSDAEEVLAVITLRRELADNEEWKADPSQPAIIVGIDLIRSKILFSGYGDGPYWRPKHAGLISRSGSVSKTQQSNKSRTRGHRELFSYRPGETKLSFRSGSRNASRGRTRFVIRCAVRRIYQCVRRTEDSRSSGTSRTVALMKCVLQLALPRPIGFFQTPSTNCCTSFLERLPVRSRAQTNRHQSTARRWGHRWTNTG